MHSDDRTHGGLDATARTRVDLRRADGSPVVVVMLVTEDWYFWSHRLAIARAARAAGARVVVATRVGAHRAAMEREGLRGDRTSVDATLARSARRSARVVCDP